MSPYVCPVCNGAGVVSADFYPQDDIKSGIAFVQCKSCKGTGIAWDNTPGTNRPTMSVRHPRSNVTVTN